jgi:hypothetical protein
MREPSGDAPPARGLSRLHTTLSAVRNGERGEGYGLITIRRGGAMWPCSRLPATVRGAQPLRVFDPKPIGGIRRHERSGKTTGPIRRLQGRYSSEHSRPLARGNGTLPFRTQHQAGRGVAAAGGPCLAPRPGVPRRTVPGQHVQARRTGLLYELHGPHIASCV